MRPPESFLGQPVRSLQTMLRVLAEEWEDPLLIIPDGIYGPETVAAVIAFQRKHGLPPTGVTDQDTWEAVVAQFEPAQIRRDHAHPLHLILNPGQVIRKGEAHPNLFLAQAILAVLADTYGCVGNPGSSGVLDEATSDALAVFQMLSALPMTGHLDKETWKHLALQYPLASSRHVRKHALSEKDMDNP